MNKIITFLFLALLASPAFAQGRPFCEEFPGSSLCVFAQRESLTPTDDGDPTDEICGAVVGAPSYDKFFDRLNGSNPDPVEKDVFTSCFIWGAYQFGRPAAGAPASAELTDEQMLEAVKGNLDDNAKATDTKYAEAAQAGKDEMAYECAVNDVLGLPCLDLVVFGPAVGVTNLGWFTGLQLALHLSPKDWPYRSGVELGMAGGYSGDEDHGDHMVHRGQLGLFVQGVVMPWRRVGFLVGAQYDHRFPGEAMDPENYLGGRFGIRTYLTDWLALDLLGTAGGVRKDNEDWSGAGGGGAALQVHL